MLFKNGLSVCLQHPVPGAFFLGVAVELVRSDRQSGDFLCEVTRHRTQANHLRRRHGAELGLFVGLGGGKSVLQAQIVHGVAVP